MNCEFFPSSWWKQALFLAWCECQVLFLYLFQMVFTLASGSFFSYIHLPVLCWTVKEIHCRSLRSLSEQQAFLWYFVLWTLSSISNSGSLLGSNTSSLCHSLGALKAVSWGNCRAHIIHFPFFRNHCPLLSYLQCLENHCLFFTVSDRRVNVILVNPCWVEAAFSHQVYNGLILFTTKISAKK